MEGIRYGFAYQAGYGITGCSTMSSGGVLELALNCLSKNFDGMQGKRQRGVDDFYLYTFCLVWIFDW